MFENDIEILKKAKNKTYNHRIWYSGFDKTVYEAIKHFADCKDFYIDLKGSIKYLSQIEGYNGLNKRKDIINYCIENFEEHWHKLIINHPERGTDRGKLKLQTYLILSNIKEEIAI